MKRLMAFTLVLAALAPAHAAQTSASFTGNWEGTIKMQRPDGTEGDPRPIVFNLTQKGKAMLMVSIAAVLALVLGAVGLYGVLSYRVTSRVQEIGIRMALGAEAKTIRRMFVWQGGRVALAGLVVGTVAAVGLTKYITTLLFNVERLDVLAFAPTPAVMLAVALLASYLPARRASRVDPVVALRAE